jgi:hypothetical protein
MREPLAEPDNRWCLGIARARQTEPGAASAGRHDVQGRDDSGVDPDPRQRRVQPGELGGAIIFGREVLQGAATTAAEMAADRLCSSRSRGEARDDPGVMAAGAARPDRGAHPVARHGERQKDRHTSPFGDPVALRAKALDDEFDYFRHGGRMFSLRPPASHERSTRRADKRSVIRQ